MLGFGAVRARTFLLLVPVTFGALLVKGHIAPRSCGRCGHLFERRALGEPVCRCG